MPPRPTCICGRCRTCIARVASRRRYRSMTPEQRREWVATRDRERVRADDRARHQARKDDPEYATKRRARQLMNAAVGRGDLERGPCEACGNTNDVQAHHDDYTRPLDVRWLCVACHAAEHHPEARAA